MKLPGRCSVCRQDVVWNGRCWRDPGRGRTVHACPEDRPYCGAPMRYGERCQRRPGHLEGQHRSLYAMQNRWRTDIARCAPPDCVLPVGHASPCRSRWFASDARRAG